MRYSHEDLKHMPFKLEIFGEDADHLVREFQRLNSLTTGATGEERSVEDLLAELRSKLADQGMAVRVVSKDKQDAAKEDQAPTKKSKKAEAPAETPETAETPEGEETSAPPPPKKSRKGLSKDEAGDALSEESPTARKARCVAKLQALFADGKKAEVMKILADHGEGAKTFAAVPEGKFGAISKALEGIDG
jgi:hypothetical protein